MKLYSRCSNSSLVSMSRALTELLAVLLRATRRCTSRSNLSPSGPARRSSRPGILMTSIFASNTSEAMLPAVLSTRLTALRTAFSTESPQYPMACVMSSSGTSGPRKMASRVGCTLGEPEYRARVKYSG